MSANLMLAVTTNSSISSNPQHIKSSKLTTNGKKSISPRRIRPSSSISPQLPQFLAQIPDPDDENPPPLEASAAKRWWRTRAIHYQNLAKLSCVSIGTLQYQLERRESQLRELLALADYYRIKSGTMLPPSSPMDQLNQPFKDDDEYFFKDDMDRRMARHLAVYSEPDVPANSSLPQHQSVDQLKAAFWRRKCIELRRELLQESRGNGINAGPGLNRNSSNKSKVPETDNDLIVSRYIVHTLNQTNLLLNYPGNRGTASHRLNFIVDSIDAADLAGKEDANYWKSKYISTDMELRESHDQIKQLQDQFGELLGTVGRLGGEKVELEQKILDKDKEIHRLNGLVSEHQNRGLSEIIADKQAEINSLKSQNREILVRFDRDLRQLNESHRQEVAELKNRLEKLSHTLNVNLLLSLDRLHSSQLVLDKNNDERANNSSSNINSVNAQRGDCAYLLNTPELTAVENELWHQTVPGDLRNELVTPPRMLTILSAEEHIDLLLRNIRRLRARFSHHHQSISANYKVASIQALLGHLEELISMFRRTDKICAESQHYVRRQAPHLLRLYHILLTILTVSQADILETTSNNAAINNNANI